MGNAHPTTTENVSFSQLKSAISNIILSVLVITSKSIMDNEVVLFLLGASALILYLIFSALTEMGTKSPWKK
ncbi:MAG: hypothetical protein HC773_21770 [Scytonema sp. CRU_2_7]|nr:hypothetical protein [Scytonema sp. CRU_2_7]